MKIIVNNTVHCRALASRRKENLLSNCQKYVITRNHQLKKAVALFSLHSLE